MNASFRTAFWAMCLGLTVPMMLFVGVELTSGGRGSAVRKGTGVSAASSLQSQWNGTEATTAGNGSPRKNERSTRSVRRPVGPRTQAGRLPTDQIFRGARLSPDLEPDIDPDLPMNGVEPAPWTDHTRNAIPLAGSVTLDPQLEPDSDLDEPPASHLRHPALPTSSRPKPHSFPGQYQPGAGIPVSRIESQLDEIIRYLERFSAASSARAPATTSDPMQQAADLLIRLQQARRIQDLAGQVLDQSSQDPSKNPSATKSVLPDKKLIPAPQGTYAPQLQPTPVPNGNDGAQGPVIVPQSSSQSSSQPSGAAGELKPAAATHIERAPTAAAKAAPQPPIVRPGNVTKTKSRGGAVKTAGVDRTPGPRAIRQAVGTHSLNVRPREKGIRKPLPERSARLKASAVTDGCQTTGASSVKSPLVVAVAPQSTGEFAPQASRSHSESAGRIEPGNSPFSGRRIPSNPE